MEGSLLVWCIPVDDSNCERTQVVMGHREKLKSGDEYDALTKARRFYGPGAGVVKRIKRVFWKRIRSRIRQAMGKLKS